MFRHFQVLAEKLDEERARLRRSKLGALQRLLSWQRLDSGLWLARLSGPGINETIEATARTRCLAIARAERDLKSEFARSQDRATVVTRSPT